MGNNNCKFCEIIELNNKEEILYQDEKVVIFNDIKPGAETHLLLVPRLHIKNVNFLTENDVDLLNYMQIKAREYLKIIKMKEVDDCLMGFHFPPFYSIPHLHMHILIPPFNSSIAKYLKYGAFFRSFDEQIKKLKKRHNKLM